MRRKETAILIGILLLLSSIVAFGPMYNATSPDSNNTFEIIDINIAMLSQTPIGWDKRAAEWYQPLLEEYQWMVGDTLYRFIITPINDDDITHGKLNTETFDVLLVPGGGVGDEESIVKGTLPNIRPLVIKWKYKIREFIQNGGGYIGYCGGAALMCDLEKTPETILEKNYEKSAIGASNIHVYYNSVANFFTCQFRKDGWKKMGAASYMLWSAYVDHDKGYPYLNGVCFDIPLNMDHPIYDDYMEQTCRVRWIGGPGLIVPQDCDSECKIGGWYPDEKLCKNESMRVHYWKYTGGISGLLLGYFKALSWCKNHNLPLSQAAIASVEFCSDWDKTNEYVDINQSNKPCIVTEIYPNENRGRIVLNTLHPERNVWWGGYIKELPDTNMNSIAGDVYQLTDYIPFDETIENEMTHTWWIVRREIAWAAKVPDNDLPPVYGASQACDIIPYHQSSAFKIIGNVEPSEGVVTVDLYYRFSRDNQSWSTWNLYQTDSDGSDGWSWVFDARYKKGHYQFNTIRRVHQGYSWLNETMAPGPDAMVLIE